MLLLLHPPDSDTVESRYSPKTTRDNDEDRFCVIRRDDFADRSELSRLIPRPGGRFGSMYARVHARTCRTHAAIMSGEWVHGYGERWCAIVGRPAMIYVGRAGAICIASVFTGRDEATPTG